MSQEEFDQIIREALAELPEHFASVLDIVRIEFRACPTPAMRRMLRLSDHAILLGLYEGRPITRRSVEESGTLPEVIYLFKDEIERICHSTDDLREQVRKTVLHELGHHFGLNEKNLDDLGYG